MASVFTNIVRLPVFRATRAGSTWYVRKADGLLARDACWVAAIAVLAVLQAALIFGHRPWLDEIQALQLAIEAPDIPTLLEWLRYEGHPPLFYLLLRGLAQVAEPLDTLPIVAAALALVTQGCILFRSAFTRTERLLLATSEFVMFEFLTLSRSMTLGTTLVFLAVACWRSRAVWLVIAILPFCDFLFGILSGIFVLLKLREREAWLPGLGLWLAGGLGAAWTVMPAPDMLPALENLGFVTDLTNWMQNVGTLAFPFQGGVLVRWNEPVFPIAGALWVVFLALSWSATRANRFHRVLLLGFAALTLVFSLAIYPLAIRHLMLIALLLIVFVWRQRERGEPPQPGFRLWLALASVCGLATAAVNFVRPFDTAREAAAEIRRLGLADKHWLVWPDSRAQVVAALTGIDFERTERHCMQSGIRWNYQTTLRTAPRIRAYLASEIERHGKHYLLSDLRIGTLDPSIVRPLARIPAGYNGQEYNLYVVGPNAAERPVRLVPCIPDRRPFERLGAGQP